MRWIIVCVVSVAVLEAGCGECPEQSYPASLRVDLLARTGGHFLLEWDGSGTGAATLGDDGTWSSVGTATRPDLAWQMMVNGDGGVAVIAANPSTKTIVVQPGDSLGHYAAQVPLVAPTGSLPNLTAFAATWRADELVVVGLQTPSTNQYDGDAFDLWAAAVDGSGAIRAQPHLIGAGVGPSNLVASGGAWTGVAAIATVGDTTWIAYDARSATGDHEVHGLRLDEATTTLDAAPLVIAPLASSTDASDLVGLASETTRGLVLVTAGAGQNAVTLDDTTVLGARMSDAALPLTPFPRRGYLSKSAWYDLDGARVADAPDLPAGGPFSASVVAGTGDGLAAYAITSGDSALLVTHALPFGGVLGDGVDRDVEPPMVLRGCGG